MTTPQERFLREEEFLRLFKKARKELDQGNLKSAIEHLEKAYELSPDSEGVENLLGILYFRVENYRKAEDIYIKLTKKNPEVFTLRTNLGLIYFKEKRYIDAIRELDKAVRLKPDYSRAHNYLGLVYVELGKYRTAREEFLRAGSRTMAKKMENIIAGSMNPETIQKSYREKEERGPDKDIPVASFILDPELKRILDDFEVEKAFRRPGQRDEQRGAYTARSWQGGAHRGDHPQEADLRRGTSEADAGQRAAVDIQAGPDQQRYRFFQP